MGQGLEKNLNVSQASLKKVAKCIGIATCRILDLIKVLSLKM